MPVSSPSVVCLQCGQPPSRPGAQMCRRCGLRYGEAPSASADLAECPVCYLATDPDGLMTSLENRLRRVNISQHVDEHEGHPVGDDAWLETMRVNDVLRIGRWQAPFDLVRRYLVTGMYDAGRNRMAMHNAILRAMSHGQKYGLTTDLLGESPEGREAREALATLMERYHRTGARGGR